MAKRNWGDATDNIEISYISLEGSGEHSI